MNENNREILGIIFRAATKEDLVHFDELVAREKFDLGLHNWQLYYSLSPDDYYVLIDPENNKLIGISTGNSLSDNTLWGQQFVLDPQYRKRKLMLATYEIVFGGKSFAGNRNSKSMRALQHLPARFEHKQIGYYGRFDTREWPVVPPAGVKIVKLESSMEKMDQKLLASLMKYDDALYEKLPTVRAKRRTWFRQWLFPTNPEHSYSVAAFRQSDNSACGYVVVRLQNGYYSIAPLYADSDDIAYALLCFVANHFKKNEEIYLEFHANRRACFQFVTEANFVLTYSNFRVYTSIPPDLPMEKLYCDHEFWPI